MLSCGKNSITTIKNGYGFCEHRAFFNNSLPIFYYLWAFAAPVNEEEWCLEEVYTDNGGFMAWSILFSTYKEIEEFLETT